MSAAQKKKIKLGALRLLPRSYLYPNLYLDLMLLEYWAQVFWSAACHVTLQLVTGSPRQFEGGALKGKSLPGGARGPNAPWCPLPPHPPRPSSAA